MMDYPGPHPDPRDNPPPPPPPTDEENIMENSVNWVNDRIEMKSIKSL